jgi:hypothetical protein
MRFNSCAGFSFQIRKILFPLETQFERKEIWGDILLYPAGKKINALLSYNNNFFGMHIYLQP